MNIGVVGCGYVGKALVRFLSLAHKTVIYDKFIDEHRSSSAKSAINKCDLCFVAVPTRTADDGWRCDLSEIEDVFSWLSAPACIKSTVVPGTTGKILEGRTNGVAFSPEYVGESEGHVWTEVDSCGFVIVGGPPDVSALVVRAYRDINPALQFRLTDSTSAELCKYMENCYLAAKISFVNQFFDIASALNVDFHELRELWLMDSRIGTSHSSVSDERGFGGKCLPKDIRAIIHSTRGLVATDLLESIVEFNNHIRKYRYPTDRSRIAEGPVKCSPVCKDQPESVPVS